MGFFPFGGQLRTTAKAYETSTIYSLRRSVLIAHFAEAKQFPDESRSCHLDDS